MTTRCEDDGGRGYGDGASAKASSMVGEGEGEALGANGGVQGVGATTWRSSRRPGARAASRWRRGELRRAGAHLSTCLPGERKQLTGHGPAQCWACQVGCQVGCGQVSSLLLFYFCFSIFCNCVALLKILRQLLKSPDYSWSIVGLFPT